MKFIDFVMEFWSQTADEPLDLASCEDLINALGLVPEYSIDLKIIMPERSGKTTITTVLWPLWLWTQDPKIRIFIPTPKKDTQLSPTAEFRKLAERSGFRSVTNLSLDHVNREGGERRVWSAYRSLGMQCDVLIVDDLLEHAQLSTERKSLVEAYKSGLRCRLVPEGSSVIVESTPGLIEELKT